VKNTQLHVPSYQSQILTELSHSDDTTFAPGSKKKTQTPQILKPLTEITGLGLVEECDSSYQTYVLIVPVKQDKSTDKHTKTNNSMFRILFCCAHQLQLYTHTH